MCHHLDRRAWEAAREEALEPEPTEATDEAEPELVDEPESAERLPPIQPSD